MEDWNPAETAMIICDMWNEHWCKGATARVAEMAPRMNEVLKAARFHGVTIIHAPSSCMAPYENTPARERAKQYNDPEVAKFLNGEAWNRGLPSEKEKPWPINQDDGGCDCNPKCNGGSPWKSQIATLEIDNDKDLVSDKGVEIGSFLKAKGIKNVILMGVHTNMCVIGRPFGLRNMVKQGKNVVLMRDMTDTMYNSKSRPYVSHFQGTDLIIEYIEKYVCPTILSTDFLAGQPFRFQENPAMLDLQLRSRKDDAIQYKTVHWNPKETSFLFVPPAAGKMDVRIKALLDTVKEQGAEVLNVPTLGILMSRNVRASTKNVVILGCPLANIIVNPEGKNFVIVRDLVNIPGAGNYRDHEKAVIELEKTGIPSFSSVDILGGQAFRFPEDKRPHVAVMVSDDHYKADVWMPALVEKFQNENDLYFTVLHGEGGAVFHGIDELETADSLVIFFRRIALRKDQLEKVKKYVESGRGVVGLRTASHAFSGSVVPGHENWNAFDHDVLGGNYHGHGKDEIGSEISNIVELADSPILKGVPSETWHSTGSVYFTDPVADNATVYQYASSPERKNMPLTWTRRHGKTRVAFTALGHWDDAAVPAFQQLYLNLILWSIEKSE
jgi:type 1 glutamine amidotransferase/nicotinamidase-related amidase